MRSSLFAILPPLVLMACGRPDPERATSLRAGLWHMEMDMRNDSDTAAVQLPFRFDLAHTDGRLVMRIHNGVERFAVDEIAIHGDSIRIRMPLFDSEFMGRIQGDSLFSGIWRNHLKGPDYVIPFVAQAGDRPRFADGSAPAASLTGKWKTRFGPACCDSSLALGLFEQNGDTVTGTFATETGDHRYLEGVFHGDTLRLSAFNGAQASLFVATLRNDTLVGQAYGGLHWRKPWSATRAPGFQLRDEDSLTFLKEGHDMVDFSFTDLSGGSVSPKDDRHSGRVVLVQVMGSWCPNCVDESVVFQEMYAKYQHAGLEVIGVAFERHASKDRAMAALSRFKQHLGIRYPICYVGNTSKENVVAQLPFLDRIMSFPTSITIGRDGRVRRIHTGFYGPGTGEYHAAYRRELEREINALLDEPTGSAALR